MAIHALVYCERLFYLEEVEEIRVADAAVWAGRRLHEELDEPGAVVEMTLESEEWGLRGRVDAIRRRDGSHRPIEHKRGRSRRDPEGRASAWEADELQVVAYAVLLEEHLGAAIGEGTIRYHADNTSVRVPITAAARERLRERVARARRLAASAERPPITSEENKCIRCSLAPVCLPEETRHARAIFDGEERSALRLFPPDLESRSLHVVTQGSRIGRSGGNLIVRERGAETVEVGLREVSDIVVHGFVQVSTQALRACANEGIPVHYLTTSGGHVGTWAPPGLGVQRRIRQFAALSDGDRTLSLAQALLRCKVLHQLQHLLRSSRRDPDLRASVAPAVGRIRSAIRGVIHGGGIEEMMGHEGAAARAYFGALPSLVGGAAGEEMRPRGRTRRPPRDRFNALLSFAYGLLARDLHSAVLRVGLDPSFGFLHRPTSSAQPLVLDLTEIFRVPVVDMAVLGAVNRRTFDPEGRRSGSRRRAAPG